jgi:hypothetical protein
MPPGKKAPPQQSSLAELWGKQKKKGVAATPPDKDKGVVDGRPLETDGTTDACPSSERASQSARCVVVHLTVLISP